MKKFLLLAPILFCFITKNYSFETDSTPAKVLGKIIYKNPPNQNHKPRSIAFKKNWPISAIQYIEYKLDTTKNTFLFNLEINEISDYTLYLNFVPNIEFSRFSEIYLWNELNNPIGTLNNGKPKFNVLKIQDFIIEKNDSLIITIDFINLAKYNRPTIKIKGNGSCNNNFITKFNKQFTDIKLDPFLPIAESLINEDKELLKRKKELLLAKDSISEYCYKKAYLDLTYNNLNNKHYLIHRNKPWNYDRLTHQKQLAKLYAFMDTIKLDSNYLISNKFRTFLFAYLKYIYPNLGHNNFDNYFNAYMLAEIFYKDRLLKQVLFDILKQSFESSHSYNDAIPYYYDFIDLFPKSEEAKILTKIYEKCHKISLEKFAPNLLLVDSLNHKIEFQELNGSVILLLNEMHKSSNNIEILKKLKEDISQDVLNISDFNSNLSKKIRNKIIQNKFKIISISNPLTNYPKQWSTFDYYIDSHSLNIIKPYIFSKKNYYILVDKNGKIIKTGHLTEDYIDPSLKYKIYELINRPYQKESKLMSFAQNHIGLLFFIIFFVIAFAITAYITNKNKLKKQEQYNKLTESELKAIRAQLNPHFLFNSLNSIQNFINNNNTQKANIHLSKFAKLMRQTLDLSNQNSINLHNEISFIKNYLELEQIRYSFYYKVDTDDTIDLYNTEIPSLITQPFIENAIIHGISELGKEGNLRIKIQETENYIIFTITDNGKGIQNNKNDGFGLKSCKDRLNLVNSQNKNKIKLKIESPVFENSYGTKITITIPEYY